LLCYLLDLIAVMLQAIADYVVFESLMSRVWIMKLRMLILEVDLKERGRR